MTNHQPLTFILTLLLLLATTSDTVTAKVRRTVNKKAQPTPTAKTEQEMYEEIDNYDFLYADATDDLNLEYDAMAVNTLIAEAKTHIGARYRSGSKGPNAFDCSGFTSYVFKHYCNMSIGASSRDQYARNIPVSRSQMQRGDLVFFTSPGSGHGIGHVGIVVDVDPTTRTFTFIHASSSEGVKISSSTDGFYARRFVGVRRVL